MQLVHRVTLAIMTAPIIVIPIFSEFVSKYFNNVSKIPTNEQSFSVLFIVLSFISLSLPLILLWAELFCISQTNGIIRGGEWLRSMEKNFLNKCGNDFLGWELWLSKPTLRTLDDNLLARLRLILVSVYYASTAILSLSLFEKLSSRMQLPFSGFDLPVANISIYSLLCIIFFLILFIGFIHQRPKFILGLESDIKDDYDNLKEYVLHATSAAFRSSSEAIKHPFILVSVGPNINIIDDPLRTIDETTRVLGDYKELYDWDSIFCGVALIDQPPPMSNILEGVLLNFLDAKKENGFIPKTLTQDGSIIDQDECCKPFLAQTALTLTKHHRNSDWLSSDNFKALVKFLDYWSTERIGPHGLFMWRSALESGVDNNAALVHYPPFSIESVDASCYLYRDFLSMSILAKERGENAIADTMMQRAHEVSKNLMSHMWDSQEYFFWNIHIGTGLYEKKRSWSGLLPLWAGFLPRDIACSIIKKYLLLEAHFRSIHGITSLDRSEPAFNTGRRTYIWDLSSKKRKEVSNWQGPVWILPNLIFIDSLITYGYISEARKLCRDVLNTLNQDLKSTGTLHECYNPDTGTSLWSPGFLSWNVLSLKMIRWLRDPMCKILPEGFSASSFLEYNLSKLSDSVSSD